MIENTYIVLTSTTNQLPMLLLVNNIKQCWQNGTGDTYVDLLDMPGRWVKESPVDIYSRIAGSTARVKNG